jgi:hypothetical protein
MPGTVVGLLDRDGFGLALGLFEEAHADWVAVDTGWKEPEAIVRVQLGKIRVNRHAGFGELQ